MQVAFDGPDAQSPYLDLPAGQSTNMPQMKGEGQDFKDSGIKSDIEDDYIDDHSSGSSHIGSSAPRRIQRRRATPQSPAVLVSHQLQQLANSLSIITSNSFRESFQCNPAIFTCPPGTGAEKPDFNLDPHAPSNYAFLQFEKSLQDASIFL